MSFSRKITLSACNGPQTCQEKVLVIGCGIIGLSSALLLQEKGFPVEIWAKDLPPNTTSNKAGAYWYPYNILPQNRVQIWAKNTYVYYRDVLSRIPAAAVKKRATIHFFQEPHPKNFYEDYVPNCRKATKDEIPVGYTEGDILETFSVDVDNCLQYLLGLFRANGGKVTRRTVNSMEECFQQFDHVVNCSGLGSRELFGDQSVFAARGQTVIVRGNGHETVVSTHGSEVIYIIPRGGDIVLGGTFQKGNESLLVSEKDTKAILAGCHSLYPHFDPAKVDIIQEKVGLRPCRPEVRLEPELFHSGRKLVVHNYGHGGGGWSTCFGCAQEVVALVENHVDQKKTTMSKL